MEISIWDTHFQIRNKMTHIHTRKNKNRFSDRKNRFRTNSRRNNRNRSSTIDADLLVKRASEQPEEVFTPSRSFDEMPIDRRLKSNLAKKGFNYPTQIQHKTLEMLKAGQDIVGIASTGTGKTGAFLIPIIEQLLNSPQSFQSLVIVPTRELAQQVEKEFESLSQGTRLYATCLIGGTNVEKDIKRLRKGNHLIVGTPGRLMDLANRGALKLNEISVLVLDEFDRMLDMGFVTDIKKIAQSMVRRRQTMMFSATLDKTQKSLIDQLLKNPTHIKVSTGNTTSDQVEQDIIRVSRGEDKFKMLLGLMADKDFEKVLVFAETKRLVNNLSKKLNQSGVASDQIHGNKSQHYRNNALDKFKRGRVQVLVATDVAARGIDVSDVTHVINYQVPQSIESYVHRIGRTGRAGKRGKALTFVD